MASAQLSQLSVPLHRPLGGEPGLCQLCGRLAIPFGIEVGPSGVNHWNGPLRGAPSVGARLAQANQASSPIGQSPSFPPGWDC